MAIASVKTTPIPTRLIAALHRAGMPAAEIAAEYCLSMDEVVFAATLPPEPLKVEDMEGLQDDAHRYELWEGELWRMSPTKKRHGRGTVRILMHLGRYLEINPIGEIYTAEVGFRVGRRRTLLCPDVAYVCHERDTPVADDEFFPYAPDIAIEVLSPDNTGPRVRRKARAYLADGARLVWAIDTRRRRVTVYRPLAEPQILTGEALLSGEEVLPGFSVPVSDLF
jgi:Uma2 family endonuclease